MRTNQPEAAVSETEKVQWNWRGERCGQYSGDWHLQLLGIKGVNAMLLILIKHEFDLDVNSEHWHSSTNGRRDTNLTHALCKLRTQLAVCNSVTHFIGGHLRAAVNFLGRRKAKNFTGDSCFDGMVD